VLPKVARGDVGQRIVPQQLARRLRNKHLTAVPGGANAGGAVNPEADVALLADRWLASVNAHAHAELCALGPALLRKAVLGFDGRGDRVRRAWKGDEEGVALRVDLPSTVLVECLPQDSLVVG